MNILLFRTLWTGIFCWQMKHCDICDTRLRSQPPRFWTSTFWGPLASALRSLLATPAQDVLKAKTRRIGRLEAWQLNRVSPSWIRLIMSPVAPTTGWYDAVLPKCLCRWPGFVWKGPGLVSFFRKERDWRRTPDDENGTQTFRFEKWCCYKLVIFRFHSTFWGV